MKNLLFNIVISNTLEAIPSFKDVRIVNKIGVYRMEKIN